MQFNCSCRRLTWLSYYDGIGRPGRSHALSEASALLKVGLIGMVYTAYNAPPVSVIYSRNSRVRTTELATGSEHNAIRALVATTVVYSSVLDGKLR